MNESIPAKRSILDLRAMTFTTTTCVFNVSIPWGIFSFTRMDTAPRCSIFNFMEFVIEVKSPDSNNARGLCLTTKIVNSSTLGPQQFH